MASRIVNEAVEMFRELEILQLKAAILSDQLDAKVRDIPVAEMNEYVEMTEQIEQASADAYLVADAQRKSSKGILFAVKAAVKNAGRDTSSYLTRS